VRVAAAAAITVNLVSPINSGFNRLALAVLVSTP
jgi:hypothetical protein